MSDMAMKYEDWLRGCVHHDGRKGNVYLPCDTVLAIADWIEAHRDVAPVRHGRWIEMSYDEYKCSVCEKVVREEILYAIKPSDREDASMNIANYCPNCGARMDGEDDEIDRR